MSRNTTHTEINFKALSVQTQTWNRDEMDVTVVVYPSEVIDKFSASQIMDVIDRDLFLDLIGEEYIKHYFDLVDA